MRRDQKEGLQELCGRKIHVSESAGKTVSPTMVGDRLRRSVARFNEAVADAGLDGPPPRHPKVAPFVGSGHIRPVASEETRAQRIARLQAEARALGGEMVEEALAHAEATLKLLRGLAEADGAVSDGLREAARTLAVELDSRVTTMRQIQGRAVG